MGDLAGRIDNPNYCNSCWNVAQIKKLLRFLRDTAKNRRKLCVFSDLHVPPTRGTRVGQTRDKSGSGLAFVDLKNGQKRLLRNLDAADFFHSLFALFLLFEQLAFA